MQQFRVGSNIDLCTKVLIAELAPMTCSMQIALPNRTTYRYPRSGFSPNRQCAHRQTDWYRDVGKGLLISLGNNLDFRRQAFA